MFVAAGSDYPLLNVFWTTVMIFLWVLWFWLLILVFSDLFRRSDISGWGKAAWALGLIVLPYLGVLLYLIVEGRSMAERRQRDTQAVQQQFDDHIRSVSANGQAADQIAKGKQLLDTGVISAAEFEQIKEKALA
jgi:type VI protein secretion system component VasK